MYFYLVKQNILFAAQNRSSNSEVSCSACTCSASFAEGFSDQWTKFADRSFSGNYRDKFGWESPKLS